MVTVQVAGGGCTHPRAFSGGPALPAVGLAPSAGGGEAAGTAAASRVRPRGVSQADTLHLLAARETEGRKAVLDQDQTPTAKPRVSTCVLRLRMLVPVSPRL